MWSERRLCMAACTYCRRARQTAWLSALHLSEGTYNGRRRKSHRIRRLLLLLDR